MEQRRRLPDPKQKLEACYSAVIDAVCQNRIGHHKISQSKTGHRSRLAIGGKSMGGRIASQVAAAGTPDVAGLVFFGYPLHPPGKPDQLRDKHLSDISAPMLFVQGSRDAFGTPDELRPILKKLKAPTILHVVEGGDHSFKVPKSAGVTLDETYRAILDRVAQWLVGVVAYR
jgi:predicted alpha/beta-hydrolase family hydrolase